MISLWENDKGSPNLNVWSKYASMLKVDLEGFILGVDKKENNLCNEIKFNNVSFANNIRAIRKKASLTQVSLAKILHLKTFHRLFDLKRAHQHQININSSLYATIITLLLMLYIFASNLLCRYR